MLEVGLSAGNHTFEVEAQNRSGTASMDTGRPRSLQVIEFVTGATILVDLATSVADAAPVSYANMTNLSASATPNSTSSVLLFLHGSQLEDGGDPTADFRFAIDGAQDGPEMSQSMDATEEGTGLMMMWAETGVTAASHTFSIQWQQRAQAPNNMDTGRQRTLQVIDFEVDASILVDVISTTADDAPGTYADQDQMSGSPDIDSTDSVVLLLANYQPEADSDDSADNRFQVGGVQVGPEISSFTDSASDDRTDPCCIPFAVTGESGVTSMSMEWQIRDIGMSTDTARPRTFQVIDFNFPGPISASAQLTFSATADLRAQGALSAAPALAFALGADLTAQGALSAIPDLAFDVDASIQDKQFISANPQLAFTLAASLRNATPQTENRSRHIERFIN